jgi:hypothetical protein
MKRYITLVIMIAAAGCAVDADTDSQPGTINGPVPGGIPTFFCTNDVDCPAATPTPCWVLGECPEPADCKLLDEDTCVKREDCVAVYNELSDAIIKPFLRCDPAPAPVCTPSGGTCNLQSAGSAVQCCPGLQCCGPALADDGGPDHCYAACPL